MGILTPTMRIIHKNKVFLLQKVQRLLRVLGRGHLAQAALLKSCLRVQYTFGKNVWAVWSSSEDEEECVFVSE